MNMTSDATAEWATHLIANGLTLVNTVLLISSGMIVVSGVHVAALGVHLLYSTLVVCTVAAASGFLSVQCIEYLHLYWCINSMLRVVWCSYLQQHAVAPIPCTCIPLYIPLYGYEGCRDDSRGIWRAVLSGARCGSYGPFGVVYIH